VGQLERTDAVEQNRPRLKKKKKKKKKKIMRKKKKNGQQTRENTKKKKKENFFSLSYILILHKKELTNNNKRFGLRMNAIMISGDTLDVKAMKEILTGLQIARIKFTIGSLHDVNALARVGPLDAVAHREAQHGRKLLRRTERHLNRLGECACCRNGQQQCRR
jgi:hypothetical protein